MACEQTFVSAPAGDKFAVVAPAASTSAVEQLCHGHERPLAVHRSGSLHARKGRDFGRLERPLTDREKHKDPSQGGSVARRS